MERAIWIFTSEVGYLDWEGRILSLLGREQKDVFNEGKLHIAMIIMTLRDYDEGHGSEIKTSPRFISYFPISMYLVSDAPTISDIS